MAIFGASPWPSPPKRNAKKSGTTLWTAALPPSATLMRWLPGSPFFAQNGRLFQERGAGFIDSKEPRGGM